MLHEYAGKAWRKLKSKVNVSSLVSSIPSTGDSSTQTELHFYVSEIVYPDVSTPILTQAEQQNTVLPQIEISSPNVSTPVLTYLDHQHLNPSQSERSHSDVLLTPVNDIFDMDIIFHPDVSSQRLDQEDTTCISSNAYLCKEIAFYNSTIDSVLDISNSSF